jgi:type II secretory pathway pseudopilin PulG
VTEMGVLSAPFGPALAAAVAAATARRASSAGVAALLAQRAAAAEAANATGGAVRDLGGATPAPAVAPVTPPVDLALVRNTASAPTASSPVAGSVAPAVTPEVRA